MIIDSWKGKLQFVMFLRTLPYLNDFFFAAMNKIYERYLKKGQTSL